MIALPMAPEGRWNESYSYQVCTKPPGTMTGTTMEAGGPILKGWVKDTFLGGAPRRQYVRLYHVASGTVVWLKLLG